jgi:starch phosphorylase
MVLQGRNAYHPGEYYQRHPEIQRVLDTLQEGRFDLGDHGIFGCVFDWILHLGDHFFHLADFLSYVETQGLASREYGERHLWTRKAILNVARMGKFSSDRCIREYAREIWGLPNIAP